jgi:hypothetical protein
MKSALIIALLASMVGSAAAVAEEAVRAQTWSLGGAAIASSDSSHYVIWSNSDGISAGVAPANASLAQAPIGGAIMQTGGFLAWQSSIYRIDATLSPNWDGQMMAGLAASVGADSGTRYGLRVGTAWTTTEHFTLNPASGLGLAEMAAPNNNVNVSFLINHALTPNLTLIGLAEAQRSFGMSPLDNSNTGLGRLVVGAGLGYRF